MLGNLSRRLNELSRLPGAHTTIYQIEICEPFQIIKNIQYIQASYTFIPQIYSSRDTL